jgi:prepilin-type N-terminal cleavage/methylation domain-containing protein
MKNTYAKRSHGFTVVELVIVIAVIAILATIGYFAFSGWRDRMAETELKSDLTNVYAAMENARNWNNGYPLLGEGTVFDGNSATKNIFTQSSNVKLTYWEGDGKTYCIDAVSKARPQYSMYLDVENGNKTPKEGSCSGLPAEVIAQECNTTKILATAQSGDQWSGMVYAKGKIYIGKYFLSGSSSNYTQLWKYDGSTTLVNEGGGWSLVGSRGSIVYGQNWAGNELWSYDGSSAQLVATPPSGMYGWNEIVMTSDGTIYMSGDSASNVYYNQLWQYKDGVFTKLTSSTASHWYGMQVASDGSIYGKTSDGKQLWRYYNGTETMVDSSTTARWSYSKVAPDGSMHGTDESGGAANALWRYSTANGVQQVASTGGWWYKVFDATTGAVYGTSSDGSGGTRSSTTGLWKYENGTVTEVDNNYLWPYMISDGKGTIYNANNASSLVRYKDGTATQVSNTTQAWRNGGGRSLILAPDGSIYSTSNAGGYKLARYKPC